MFRWKNGILPIIVVGILVYIFAWPLNAWLSFTMPRHQLMQLPTMLALGIVLGNSYPKIKIRDSAYGISALIFVMFSLVFWMLPRSVDLGVIRPWINRIMHLNMLVAGFLTVIVLKNIVFEIRVAFLGMNTAMLLATGMTLYNFDLLLCSSYNISQQQTTGLYLIFFALALFVITIAYLIRGMSQHGNQIKSLTSGAKT